MEFSQLFPNTHNKYGDFISNNRKESGSFYNFMWWCVDKLKSGYSIDNYLSDLHLFKLKIKIELNKNTIPQFTLNIFGLKNEFNNIHNKFAVGLLRELIEIVSSGFHFPSKQHLYDKAMNETGCENVKYDLLSTGTGALKNNPIGMSLCTVFEGMRYYENGFSSEPGVDISVSAFGCYGGIYGTAVSVEGALMNGYRCLTKTPSRDLFLQDSINNEIVGNKSDIIYLLINDINSIIRNDSSYNDSLGWLLSLHFALDDYKPITLNVLNLIYKFDIISKFNNELIYLFDKRKRLKKELNLNENDVIRNENKCDELKSKIEQLEKKIEELKKVRESLYEKNKNERPTYPSDYSKTTIDMLEQSRRSLGSVNDAKVRKINIEIGELQKKISDLNKDINYFRKKNEYINELKHIDERIKEVKREFKKFIEYDFVLEEKKTQNSEQKFFMFITPLP